MKNTVIPNQIRIRFIKKYDKYKVGDTVEVVEPMAMQIIERGYAIKDTMFDDVVTK